MTKKTSIIRKNRTASANGNAAISSVETVQPADSAEEARSSKSSAARSGLQSIFSQYKDAAEILKEIEASPEMTATFRSWPPARQQEFLDFCSGNRGIRILYDAYFKYVFDPSARPEELSRMISALIGLDVNVVQVLPNESCLGADYTLVIMDIIVETGDGSIINVEVQKIGYNFPGERAACYNADLLLRQYQRIRKEYFDYDSLSAPDEDADGIKREKFSYRRMRPVYTIVFMEKSTKNFHEFPEDYIHTFAPASDTGLNLNLLQNYVFVPLDIFRRHLASLFHSADGRRLTEQEAWLAFLSSDDPRIIRRLLDQYPSLFRSLYDRICMMCRNTKEMMNMFSEELSIMDKNTVMLMIEEQQEIIDQLQKNNFQAQQELTQTKEALTKAETERARFEAECEKLRRELLEARLGKTKT